MRAKYLWIYAFEMEREARHALPVQVVGTQEDINLEYKLRNKANDLENYKTSD